MKQTANPIDRIPFFVFFAHFLSNKSQHTHVGNIKRYAIANNTDRFILSQIGLSFRQFWEQASSNQLTLDIVSFLSMLYTYSNLQCIGYIVNATVQLIFHAMNWPIPSFANFRLNYKESEGERAKQHQVLEKNFHPFSFFSFPCPNSCSSWVMHKVWSFQITTLCRLPCCRLICCLFKLLFF